MNTCDDVQNSKWSSDWKILILFALLSYLFAFGLRAMELPKWGNPAFMVDGEYILGTHDAYAWLAGAKGVGRAVDNPMAELVRVLGSVTGAPYGNIAFWLPAVFAGFTAVAAFAWGVLLGGPWLGFCAGVFATSIPMFYYRTRLSYYDTDVVTLLFPLIISFLMIFWLNRGIRNRWLPDGVRIQSFQPTMFEYFLPVLGGVFVSFGKFWHTDVFSFGLYTIFAATFLVFICASKENRPILLRGITLFVLPALFGWIGGALSILFIAALIKIDIQKYHFFKNVYFYLFIVLVALVLSDAGVLLINLFSKMQSYLKPISDAAQASVAQLHYPSIGQSVIEAQNIKFAALLNDLTGNMYLSCFGLFGFLFLLARRPQVLLLLPFAVMTIAAVKLGGRFAMFGGIAVGLGGCYFLYWLIFKFVTLGKQKVFCSAGASAVLIIYLMVSILPGYSQAMPTPIIYQEHAKALKAMSGITPQNSTFWTWWDWGYATMYFTGQNSFADGSNHGGTTLFPLAFAYTTPSFMQANQFIKYAGSKKGGPSTAWSKMSAEEVVGLVRSFGFKDYGFKNTPKQYIVTTWSDVRLAYWILYYGSCDLLTGQGVHPNISTVNTAFSLDKDAGRLLFGDGASLPISGFDVAYLRMGESRVYSGSVAPFLVYNKYIGQGYLVNDMARNSLLFRLLLMNPSSPEIKGKFKLVYEGFPLVRIYEVL
ncbi:hypothetical protein [Maridesulfovibrio sp.]|uniref:hypothetical protein n=1 Tax=Maridesulfovibrio sp. TaxID=2795000 RepID=UPI0039F1320A